MALIEIDRDPSPRDLWTFVASLPLLFGVIGAWRWHAGSQRGALAIWGVGLALTAIASAHPALRRGLHRTWALTTYPLGWTVSQLLLLAIWALVATPTALVLRLLGRDPLQRRFDRRATTYWTAREPGRDPSRHFRQS